MDSITPYTMALIAKYIARHRLRETRLLDTIADFLVKKAEYLDSKVRAGMSVGDVGGACIQKLQVCLVLCPQVIQKLVFPFSRMSYSPSNEQQFFSRLEEVVELKALNSPLATVNILMSLLQLGHFPGTVLHRVFSSAFISNVISQCLQTTEAEEDRQGERQEDEGERQEERRERNKKTGREAGRQGQKMKDT